MLYVSNQFFGGRGSGGGKGAGGGIAGGQSGGFKSKLNSALNPTDPMGRAMKDYNVSQVLDQAPIGQKVDVNGVTYQKTSYYGWTRNGDLDNYDPVSANNLAQRLGKTSEIKIAARKLRRG